MRNWYPLIMLAAFAVGGWLLRSRQSRLPLSQSDRFYLNLSAFCGAMFGARVPFVLEPTQWSNPFFWIADGKTILGGIFGAYFAVECTKIIRGIRVSTGDAYAFPAAVTVGIGRIGCFAAGCCYGVPTSLPCGVDFHLPGEAAGTLRHPAQLYEAAFHALAACLLWVAEQHQWLPKQRLKAYLIAYLIYRFVSETWRPEVALVLGLTAYQVSSVVLVLILVALWVRDRRPAVEAIT